MKYYRDVNGVISFNMIMVKNLYNYIFNKFGTFSIFAPLIEG